MAHITNFPPLGTSKPFACPSCGHTSYFEGPSGGATVNVTCAYIQCRKRWNWSELLHYYEPIGIANEANHRYDHWDDEIIPLDIPERSFSDLRDRIIVTAILCGWVALLVLFGPGGFVK